jgi:glutathione peroxidase
MRSAYEVALTALTGEPIDPRVLRGRASLIVNVASRCGFTPQYEALQRLYERYREGGLVVLGTPCDQFGNQEPGSPEEIAAFCSDTYGVTFPLTEKLDVNGANRHPLYRYLTTQHDQSGTASDVQWNFEKFLVSPRGQTVARFRSPIPPDADELLAALEPILPGGEPTWTTRPAGEVVPGDRVRLGDSVELTATRISHRFFGQPELICLIEDTPTRWFAQPVRHDTELQVLTSNAPSGESTLP